MPTFEEHYSQILRSQLKAEEVNLKIIKKHFHPLAPIQTAATFCGLATLGSLQSNHIRIANLIHASLKYGTGKKKIKKHQVNFLFNLMGGTTAGRDEDPAEDVFITSVCSKQGTYLVYEGNWEASCFYLERFIDIVDSMPDTGHFAETKRSINALLVLSNIVAIRSGERSNIVTAPYPNQKLPPAALQAPAVLCDRVRLTTDELKLNDIDPALLRPFIFAPSLGQELPLPAHRFLTLLDMHPILWNGRDDYFLFPQGVSTAIRSLLLARYARSEKEKEFLAAALIRSYQDILQKYQFLGKLPSPLDHAHPSYYSDKFSIFEALASSLGGRPLHCLFLFDHFRGNLADWSKPISITLEGEDLSLSRRIEKAQKAIEAKGHTKEGVTLLISAGWGRPWEIIHDYKSTDDWSVRHISMHDLCTLSDYPSMEPLELWRLIRMENCFASLKGQVMNINGMLNLFGWLANNNWHIVPHEQLPKEDLSVTGIMLNIPTSIIAEVREQSRRARDRRMLPNTDGNAKYVMRYEGNSYFQEDHDVPLYGCLESVGNGTIAAAFMYPTIFILTFFILEPLLQRILNVFIMLK